MRTSGSADTLYRNLKSCVFTTQDGSAWQLELRPKSVSEFQVKLVIHAVETPDERQGIHRKLLFKPAIHRAQDPNNYQGTQSNLFEKDMAEAFFVSSDDSGLSYQYQRFISFSHASAVTNKYTKCLTLEVSMIPKVFHQSDYDAYK